MGKYRITDPRTGKTVTVSGEAPPNEEQVREIFAAVGQKAEPTRMFEGIPNRTGAVLDTVKGNAAEELPSVASMNRVGPRSAIASVLGSDEDYVNAVRSEGAEIRQDQQGNPIAQFEDGQEGYVNQPGLDIEDVARFAGKVGAFTPAGRLASGASSIGGKMLAMGAGSAATDVAMQGAASTAGGDPKINPGQTAATFFMGAAAELGAPLLKTAAKILRWGRGPTAKSGREIAKQIKVPGYQTMPDDEAIALARAADKASREVRPEALVAESQGLRPNIAQQTDDYWRELDMARELPGPRSAGNEQISRAVGNVKDAARRVGGAADDEGANLAMRGVRDSARALRAQADDAYKAAGSMEGSVKGDAFDDLFGRMDSIADRGWIRGEHNAAIYPASRAVLGNIDSLKAQLGAARASPGFQSANAPFQAVEDFRQSMVAARSAAKGKDGVRVGEMMREFDSWLDDAFDRALINGDDAFLQQAKEARSLWSRYKQNFAERSLKKGTDSFGKKMEMFVNGDLTEDQMVNYVLGSGQNISSDTAMQFVSRMRGNPNIPKKTYDEFAQGMVEKLVMRPDAKDFGVEAIQNRLHGFLYGRKYRNLAESALTKQQIDELKRLEYGLRGLMPGGELQKRQARSSGTAERLFGMMSEFDPTGFVGKITKRLADRRMDKLYSQPRILQRPQGAIETLSKSAAPAASQQGLAISQ